MKNSAFVFTGFAFLLVIPAAILAASFINMLKTGDIGTSTALRSDLVFYAYSDIKTSFERTSCNLVYTYGSNITQIRQSLNTTWADLIEKNYTQKVGINASLQRSRINVSDNTALHRIQIGNLNTNEGIPIAVTDLTSDIVYNSTIGPVISSYNNPPSTPSLLSPISGWTTREAITLDWTNSTDAEGDNVTYQVQVDSSNNYTSNSYLTVSLSNGTYTWRVKATDGIENLTFADPCKSVKRSNWTETRSFTVNTGAPSLTVVFYGYSPCKRPGGGPSGNPVRVLANVSSQGATITDANVTVELRVSGVLQETGTMLYNSGGEYPGLYGSGVTDDDNYWESSSSYSDTVYVTVYALRTGYASASVSNNTQTTNQCPT